MEKLPERLRLPKTQVKESRLFDRTFLQPLFLRVRCPECGKLYRVDTRDVKSANPEFDCLTCHTVFTVQSQPKNPRDVQTRVLRKSALALEKIDPSQAEKFERLKKCPKCETWNPKLSDECFKCGVLFSRVGEAGVDEKERAFPSLTRAWKELLRDYQNLSKHFQFIDQCDELRAVPFALRRYELMKETQPQDEIAKKMFDQAWLRSLTEKTQAISRQVNWRRTAAGVIVSAACIFIMIGIFQPAARNLIGAGISLLFLFVAIRFLFR